MLLRVNVNVIINARCVLFIQKVDMFNNNDFVKYCTTEDKHYHFFSASNVTDKLSIHNKMERV